VPGSQLRNNGVNKVNNSIKCLRRFNEITEVSARRETALSLDSAEDSVVLFASCDLLVSGDTSFSEKLKRSTASLEVLFVRRRRGASEKGRSTILEIT
jgi:uncharacterized linocin/CFP29 family protein